MPRVQSKLSGPQTADLIEFLAANNQTYETYLRWANQRELPDEKRFTKWYWNEYIKKIRPRVHIAIEEQKVAARRVSMMGREQRLHSLEETYNRLEKMAFVEENSDKLIRLEEQKRKTLEHIAKERGEWGKGEMPADRNDAAVSAMQATMAALKKHGLLAGPSQPAAPEFVDSPEVKLLEEATV